MSSRRPLASAGEDSSQRRGSGAHGVDVGRLQIVQPLRRRFDQIGHEPVQQRDDRLRLQHRDRCVGHARARLGVDVAPERDGVELFEREQLRTQAVVEIVIGVGDLVGAVGHLRFERRLPAAIRQRHRVLPVRAVLEDALARLVAEVESAETRVALFEQVDDAQRLAIVVEAAVVAHQAVERAFAGVTERRVTEVVRQRDRLGEILVEPQRPRDGARDLRAFERVREPVAVVIALVVHEDLRLVLEAAEGVRVEHAVAIALERRAQRMIGFGDDASARGCAAHCVGREAFALFGFVVGAAAEGDHGLVLLRTRSSSWARDASLIDSLGWASRAAMLRSCAKPAASAMMPSMSAIQRFKFQPHEHRTRQNARATWRSGVFPRGGTGQP